MKKLFAILMALALLTGAALAEGADLIGTPAPNFTVTTCEGDQVVLSDLLAEKDLVVLNIFTSWCPPCRMEFPGMQSIYEALSDRMEIVAVSSVTELLTGVGVLALVVGFGAESLIADVVTGFFMLFENQYNVGDIVEVNGFRGTVKEIGIRTTAIEDVGKNIKIVNNSDMKNILNRSDNASMAAADIDIPYGADLEKLEAQIPKLMEDIYSRHSDMLLAPPRYLGVQALGASGITLRFAAEIDEGNIFNAPRILNRDLLLGFRALGVECPFPQLELHNS